MAVSAYDTTAANNITISGINIGEGCDPANINNAIRQQLADIATWRTTGMETGTGLGHKFLAYTSGNDRYGIGMASSTLQIYSASSSVVAFGTISTSDGSTFTETARQATDGSWRFGSSSAVGSSTGRVQLWAISGSFANCLETQPNTNVTYNAAAFRNSSGTAVGTISASASATTYNTSSDERMKENFASPPDFGAILDQVEIVSYDFKDEYGGGHVRWGIKAQTELSNIPEAIKQGSEGEDMSDPWGWIGNPLIAGMMLELQKLRQRLAVLEAAQ